MIEIKSFDQGSELVGEFREYPAGLYKNDRYWMNKDEYYPGNSRFFLAYAGGKPAGRACGIINPEIRYQDRKTGLIGFYECDDDTEASGALIGSVQEHLMGMGVRYLIGPMNGSTWQSYRITEPSDNPPFFLDNYHKRWYKEHFIKYGFEVIARYISTRITRLEGTFDRLERFEKIFERKGVRIRTFNADRFDEELEKIYKVSIECFKDNFLYTPISFREFAGLYAKIRKLIDPGLIFIAEDLAEEPLGFIFSIDNIFGGGRKSLLIKTLAALSYGRSMGVGALLAEKIHKTAFDKGYQEIFHALMHERNISTQILSDNSELYHRYLLFGKELR